MKSFPIEIINIILEYQGYHVYRHGKYMKQIYCEDPRIKMLFSMPKIMKTNYGNYVCFWKTVYIETIQNMYTWLIPRTYKKDICFMIGTTILPSSVLWVMNISKYYDCNSSYDDSDRIQFILN
jgi:hypothetical protein